MMMMMMMMMMMIKRALWCSWRHRWNGTWRRYCNSCKN